MTPQEIDTICDARDRLTNRRDEEVDWEAVDAFDAALDEGVPPGQNNRVDKYLGRECAVMPKRPDYGLSDAQYRALSSGLPDGIVEHDDALAGAWM